MAIRYSPISLLTLARYCCSLSQQVNHSRTCCYRQKHAEEDQVGEQAVADDIEDDDDHKPVVKRRGKPKFMF